MVLDFAGIDFERPRQPVAGPQYDQEATNYFITSHTSVGTAEETVYTVPAGKTLYISKLLYSADAAPGMVTFIDGVILHKPSDVFQMDVDFLIPLTLTAGQVLSWDSNEIGRTITAIGWLI